MGGASVQHHGDVTVMRQVLSYFVRHPRAVDSLEGVARWRLLDEVIHVRVEETRRALDALVARGILRQTDGPGLQPGFSIDGDRIAEAERLLAELASPKRRRRARSAE